MDISESVTIFVVFTRNRHFDSLNMAAAGDDDKISATENTDSQESDYDIFRDSYVRYLGYANEVGESFRPLVHVNFVWATYAVASGYVIADSVDKMYRAKQAFVPQDEEHYMKRVLKAGADSLVWQSFASVIVPGITINRLVAMSGFMIKKSSFGQRHAMIPKTVPTALGLLSIPLIIQPIDHGVHWVMNRSFRPWIGIPEHES